MLTRTLEGVDAKPVVTLHKPRSILHFFHSVSTYGLVTQSRLLAPWLCLNPCCLTMLEVWFLI